ncbi:CHAT domain-containing protein [Streptomyces sp. NPDC086766]|uniref:CHAT domain-containing protein n=1 Tax=Streptomyces sp. NPDC086766 TaxID=3365754 RepID=UPI003817C0B9
MATDLELELCAVQPGEYEVRVIRAPSGGEPCAALRLGIDELVELRPELERTVLASSVSARRKTPVSEQPVQQVGQHLFESLFTGPVYGAYRASLGVAQERHEKLRVVLRLEAPQLALLPWETLFDPETGSYLCRHEPLVRHVAADGTPEPLPVTPPLRILVLIASPRGLPPLDVDAERERLEQALAKPIAEGRVELAWVEQAGWDSVHAHLFERQWHVLHFIGHGDYDSDTDEGLIALVGENGAADMVEASRLADLLTAVDPAPRLVVLNSCASAQGGVHDVFSSTGAALVRRGISAVAAMQFTISDRAAVRFSHGFYTSLAYGQTIDEAVRQSRISMLGGGSTTLEWITPVLYVRGESTHLFTFTAPPTPTQGPGQPPPEGRPLASGAEEAQRRAQLRALYVMASAEVRLGNLDKAIEVLDDLLILDPGNRDAATLKETATRQRRLGDLYQHATDAQTAGDWDTAIDIYTELLQTDPDYQDTPQRLEVCRARRRIENLQAELRYLADTGQWQAVLNVSEELHGLDPAAADPDGLTTQARHTLEQAEGDDLERWYAEARAAEDDANWAGAASLYDRILTDSSGYRDAVHRREICLRRKRLSELRTAHDQRPTAASSQQVPETLTEMTAVQPDAAGQNAAVTESARHETPAYSTEIAHLRFGASSLSWHPDGQRIAVSGQGSGVIHVYDTTGTERLKIRSEAAFMPEVNAVAFSPDGHQLANTDDGAIKVWHADSGRKLLEFDIRGQYALAFSPDGTQIATTTNRVNEEEPRPGAHIWNAATGQQIHEIQHRGAVFAVAFSPDGTLLATGGHRSARIWDVPTGRQIHELQHGDDYVWAVAFSPDGTLFATGGHRSARIWDVPTGRQIHELQHKGHVPAVAFSPDGTLLATGGHRSARIWDVPTGRQIRELQHKGHVRAVAFSPDGTRLATCSEGAIISGTITLWPVA